MRHVACTGRPDKPAFRAVARSEALARRLGWQVTELATGHRAPAEDPEAVAAVLASAA